MTEYEQLLHCLQSIGVPHAASISAYPTKQPAQQIDIEAVNFWFNSRGEFLEVYHTASHDPYAYWKRREEFELRVTNPGRHLDPDTTVEENAVAQKKQDEAMRRQQLIALVEKREALPPLPRPGYARQALDVQARALLRTGDAATIEQAIDAVAQRDPQLLQLVLDEEAAI